MSMNKYNPEHYHDPTAMEAINIVMVEEHEIDKKAHNLVNVLKFIVDWAGFELVERVQLRHTKSGRVFK